MQLTSATAASRSSSPGTSLFVYGTLMSPRVLSVLIGRVPSLVQPAFVEAHRRHPVVDHIFPGTIPSSSSSSRVEGILLQELKPSEMQVLDWFEGEEYTRQPTQVQIPNNNNNNNNDADETTTTTMAVECLTYLWSNPLSQLDTTTEWSFANFQQKEDWYLTHTVRPCRRELDRLGIGVAR